MRRIRIIRPPPNVLTALSGAFAWAGHNATLIRARHLVATLNTRTFTWAGSTAAFTNGPKLLSATVQASGNTINLVFSQAVRIGSGGGAGFSLALTGGLETLTYSSGTNTATLVYSLSRQVGQGETGTISYATTVDGIETLTGNDLQATSRAIVNSSTYTGPPVLLTAVVPAAGTSVTLNFDKAVLPGSVTNSGLVLAMSGGSFSGATLTYTSTGATSLVFALGGRIVFQGETGNINYTQPPVTAERIKAALGGADVASFSSGVTNSSQAVIPPTRVSAIISGAGTTLSLTFSAAVNPGIVTNAGLTLTMSGGSFSGSTLTYASGGGGVSLIFNLGSRTVGSSETGTIGYVQPVASADRIKATAGGADVASFSNAVTNSSSVGLTDPDAALAPLNKYVRQGAAGSATGNDWTNAYTTLPATLARSTTYWIADGTYSGYEFDDLVSGSNVIRIKKATEALHGTSTGWSTAYGVGQAAFTSGHRFLSSNWIFDGSTGGGPGSWDSGFGFRITETADTGAMIQCSMTSGNATVTANNITVRHVEMHGKGSAGGGGSRGNDGVALRLTDRFTISYYSMTGIGRCPFFFYGNSNTMMEYGLVDSYYGSDSGHADLISSGGDVLSGYTVFRYSLVRACASTGGIMWDNASDNTAVCLVYGNIFDATNPPVAWGGNNGVIGGWTGNGGEDCRNLLAYNNTFVNVPLLDSSGACLGELPLRFSGCEARNNLFYSCPVPGGGGPWTTKTHNHFISTPSIGTNTSTGSGNPFVSIAGRDYHLTANTPTGTALSAPYNVDMYGNVRSTWTRGAVEYI